MATSDAHTTARELYATLVNTAIATSLNQLRAALPKLKKSSSDDPKAVKAALPRNTSSDVRDFLVDMAEQGTLNQLADIIDILEQYSQETPAPLSEAAPAPADDRSTRRRSASALQAEVVNPGPLSEARKSRMIHELHQLYGPELDINFVEDDSLKGSMIIRVRDLEAPNKLGGEFSEIIQMLESGEEHLEAEVVSAVPLSQEQQERISHELQQCYDAQLDLHFREDESLIGGLIIRVGDQVLDNSLRARMGAVQRSMMTT